MIHFNSPGLPHEMASTVNILLRQLITDNEPVFAKAWNCCGVGPELMLNK